MAFTINTPLANQLLSDSAPIMNANFQALNTWTVTDHYAVSDTSGNFGFHKTITTPSQGTSALVTTTNPLLYGYVPSTAVGLIQYSGGISGAPPTPLTSLISSATPIVLAPSANKNVLDFTGLNPCIAELYFMNAAGAGLFVAAQYTIYWYTGNMYIAPQSNRTGLLIAGVSSSTILQIQNPSSNTYSNIYYVLKFLRTS